MRQSSSSLHPRRPSFLALLLVAGLQAYCKRAQSVGQQCVFNSDCDQDSHLVCAGRVCRPQCNLTVPNVNGRHPDCPAANTYCGSTGQPGIGACLDSADPGYCVYASDCRAPYVCTLDGRCAAQCRMSRDCVAISLDPAATCEMTDDVGTCSFRDSGVRVDESMMSLPDTSTTDTVTVDTSTAADGSSADASVDAPTSLDAATSDR